MSRIKRILLAIVTIGACIGISMYADAKTIKVLVIDTGVDLSHEEIKSHVRKPWNLNYYDNIGHGTAMAGLILNGTCGDIELISCRYHFPWDNNYIKASNNCFKRALAEDIQYINYSSSGAESNTEEKEILKQLSDKGVIIVIAAGNHGLNLTKSGKCRGSYPGCYLFKNLYIVQNIDKNEILAPISNYLNHPNARRELGINVPVLFPDKNSGLMTGTSPATAKYTNSLLLRRCWELRK